MNPDIPEALYSLAAEEPSVDEWIHFHDELEDGTPDTPNWHRNFGFGRSSLYSKGEGDE